MNLKDYMEMKAKIQTFNDLMMRIKCIEKSLEVLDNNKKVKSLDLEGKNGDITVFLTEDESKQVYAVIRKKLINKKIELQKQLEDIK